MFNLKVEEHICTDTSCCHHAPLTRKMFFPSPTKSPPLSPSLRKLELYTHMYHSCFLPATTDTISPITCGLRKRKLSIRECIRKRALLHVPTHALMEQVGKSDADHMLEYGLRLYSGVDENIPVDHTEAASVFMRLFYEPSTKGSDMLRPLVIGEHIDRLACGLGGHLFISMLGIASYPVTERNIGFMRAALGALLQANTNQGFTPVCLWFCTWATTARWPLYKLRQDCLAMIQTEMDIYHDETGVQDGLTRCAYCHKSGVRKAEATADSSVVLKLCAGDCRRQKKPLYCSHKCQSKDWENHRRWCLQSAKRKGLVDDEEYF